MLRLAADGAGLLCGVFEHFLALGVERPKVIGATHLHEIFENRFLQPRSTLSLAYMEVRVDGKTSDPECHLTYLYQ